jgi:hypothetical protein
VTAGAVPVPVSATAWGLFAALSVTVTLADLAPAAVGVNFTLMVQLAATAKLAPQLFVWAKSPLLLPVTEMLVRVKAAVPLFVSVIALEALATPTGWLPNASDVGDKVTAGAVPVPVRATVWGLFAALSVMVSAPDLAPVAVGLNVTLMEQFAPAATLVPQLFVCEKSPLLVPVNVMLVRVNAAVPLLVSVTARAALPVPTCWLPNASDVGDSVTEGAVPVPVSAAV